jgi:DNA polymerase
VKPWGRDAVIALAEKYEDCALCPALCESRSSVVFGSGSTRADLMIVGDSPGKEEDDYVEPFVGETGKLFLNLLQLAWPATDELSKISTIVEGNDEEFFEELRSYFDDYIFWTNVLCCMPEDGRSASAKELKACKERLEQTVYAVDPMLIIAVGKAAATALLGRKVGVLDKRGMIFDITIKSPETGNAIRYPMLVVISPGHLLSSGSLPLLDKKRGKTYDTVEDLKYGIQLLNTQYQDLFEMSFPDRPQEHKNE